MLVGTEATPQPSPVPSDPGAPGDAEFVSELNELLEHPEQVFARYGVDVDGLTSVQITASGLIQALVAMAAVVLILRSIYRGMQHPRLALQEHPDAPPTVSWQSVRRYVWTPLVLIPLWYLAILAVLVIAANRGGTVRPPLELVVAAAVVVGASRLLAHLNLEAAHELAKSVPLTLISLILISGQTVSLMGAIVLGGALFLLGGSVLISLLWLGVFDVVITAVWFGYQRRAWRRRAQQELLGPKTQGWASKMWRRLSRACGSASAGPSPHQRVVPMVSQPSADPESTADPETLAEIPVALRQMMLLPDQPPRVDQRALL